MRSFALLKPNHRLALLALFTAMAVCLHWIEAFIPTPLPFVKLGLANIFTLTALMLFGGAWGLLVAVLRVLLGSLLAGGLFTPTFFFALGGAVAAALTMWAAPKRLFGPIGTSVLGALAHMSTQLALAAVIVQHAFVLKILPVFLLSSLITGIINGYTATLILDVIRRNSRVEVL